MNKELLLTEVQMLDLSNKWAIHSLVKSVVESVESKDISIDEQSEILDVLYVRMGWKKSN